MTTEHTHEHHHVTAAFMVNHLIANQGVLNMKLHQFHWYVQGPDFFTLHEKFEALYNEANEYFVAERLLAIGEKPYSTLGEFLEHAFIDESVYDEKITAPDMVQTLVEDYRTIRDVSAKGIHMASDEGDHVTEDMLVDYKATLDKNIWMLQAYLGKEALEDEDD